MANMVNNETRNEKVPFLNDDNLYGYMGLQMDVEIYPTQIVILMEKSLMMKLNICIQIPYCMVCPLCVHAQSLIISTIHHRV